MSKVSVSRREIVISTDKTLKFWAGDVHKVFGIPCGHRNVKGRDASINPEAINFIKATLQMNKSGVHSLSAAEEFLMRDINEESSKLEKDCFQIAFVIFIMGHVLAPTTKHNYCNITYSGQVMQEVGPLDFANYLRRQYPNLVADEITMLLKQQNARAIMQMSRMKNAMHWTWTSPQVHGTSSRKRGPMNEESSTSRNAPPAADALITYFKALIASVAVMYADLPDKCNVVVFGQSREKLPTRKYIFQHRFAADPWEHGTVPYPPNSETTNQLIEHISATSEKDLQRFYITHVSPRLVRIRGTAVRDQLIGSNSMDHELVCIIFRRFRQSDNEANSECPYLSWRHFIEADFATFVLADYDYVSNISIQRMLDDIEVPYDITSARMFFLPVPLDDGWVLLMWDMMARKLHVMDPQTRGDGPCMEKKDKFELVAWKLHHALFQCLNEYFAGWPTQDGMWETQYPVLAQESFDSDE